jgi:hypothetical protein
VRKGHSNADSEADRYANAYGCPDPDACAGRDSQTHGNIYSATQTYSDSDQQTG